MSQLYVLEGLTITFDATITKLRKIDIKPRESFDGADLVDYDLISIDFDEVGCDRIAHSDNSSKFGIEKPDTSSDGVVVILVIVLLVEIIRARLVIQMDISLLGFSRSSQVFDINFQP